MSDKRLIDYLNLEAETVDASVEAEKISISGAAETVVQHSSMFYQPFDSKVCKTLCDIFSNLATDNSDISKTIGLKAIENMLRDGAENRPNLECLLYATRIANTRILNDENLLDRLTDFVAVCYEDGGELSFETVKHIFSAWNWQCQIGLAFIGAMAAERNQVKRNQLLSEMKKYRSKDGADRRHLLLLHQTKGLITRGSEYAQDVFEILVNLENQFSLDEKIASVIKQSATKVFKGNEAMFDAPLPKESVARNAFGAIKKILGYVEIDDDVSAITLGNTSENDRLKIEKRLANNDPRTEKFCRLIRKNKLRAYIPVFKKLLESGSLTPKTTVVIASTYAEMNKARGFEVEQTLRAVDLPDDFLCLILYTLNSNGPDRDFNSLEAAIDQYFSDDCSEYLRAALANYTKFDQTLCAEVVNQFSYLIEQYGPEVSHDVLRKFDSLLIDPKSLVLKNITRNTKFLVSFQDMINGDLDLDSYPKFFDKMITIIRHCPEDAVKKMYAPMYMKTKDEKRQQRLRRLMKDAVPPR